MTITAVQAIAKAKTQLGVPYKWGGDTPAEGFDCSGLLFWVMSYSGPRTSQLMWASLPHVVDPAPGDYVVFYVDGEGPAAHVGMYLSPGWMLDAPETGEDVSIQRFPFEGGYVMGYVHPPYAAPPVLPPPPIPDTEEDPMFIASDTGGSGEYLVMGGVKVYIPETQDIINLRVLNLPTIPLSHGLIEGMPGNMSPSAA